MITKRQAKNYARVQELNASLDQQEADDAHLIQMMLSHPDLRSVMGRRSVWAAQRVEKYRNMGWWGGFFYGFVGAWAIYFLSLLANRVITGTWGFW